MLKQPGMLIIDLESIYETGANTFEEFLRRNKAESIPFSITDLGIPDTLIWDSQMKVSGIPRYFYLT